MPSKELQDVLAAIKSQPAIENPTVEQRRARSEERATRFPLAGDVRVEAESCEGIPAEWVSAPDSDPERVILYLHGGGYVTGSCNTHRELASRLSRSSGARCLVVDYRLAPEHPFPAPVEDATAAYRWLLGQGIDPAQIVIAGDSAGGGLAIAALVALRDAGDPLPAGAVCISPWTDMAITGASIEGNAAVDPSVQRTGLEEMARLYMGDQDPNHPLASPINADLSGLPPMLIQVGAVETLLDDASGLAERARSAGCAVAYESWPEMFHVWHQWAPMLPEGQQAIERIGDFVRERTG